jgi:hypothetical protein
MHAPLASARSLHQALRSTKAHATLFGAALLFISFYFFDPIATNDGPSHLLPGDIIKNWSSTELRFSECYEPNVPWTNHGPELFWLFSAMFGAKAGGWLAALALASLLGASAALLSARLTGRVSVAAVVLPALAGPMPLGLFPFVLATALAVLAVALAAEPLTQRRGLAVATCLLTAVACHPAPVIAAGPAILLLGNRSDVVVRVLSGLPSVCLTLAVLAGTQAFVGAALTEKPVGDVQGALLFLSPSLPMLGVPVVVAGIGFTLAQGAPRTPAARLSLYGLLLLVLGMLLPETLGSWQYGGRRTLVFGLVLVGSALGTRRSGAVVGALLALIASVSFAVESFRVSAQFAAIERANASAAFAIPADERFAAQRQQPRGFNGLSTPTFGFAHVVSMKHGGINVMGHLNSPALHHMLARCVPANLPSPTGLRPLELTQPLVDGDVGSAQLLAWASHSEAVLLLGDNGDAEFLRRAGYTVSEAPPLLLARDPKCRLRIETPAPVDVGYWPFMEPARTLSSGEEVVLPCGWLWVGRGDCRGRGWESRSDLSRGRTHEGVTELRCGP